MKFAIIAAGEGSRLAQEGIDLPKPLVSLCGEPMIARLLRIFAACGAEEIIVMVNQLHPETAAFVSQQAAVLPCPLRVVEKTTPSSMHSFYELSQFLGEAPFCLTTVDTIFKEDDFRAYIEAFRKSPSEGMMAVTDFIDDEKPLYVGTDEALTITGFYDEPQGAKYISGGVYCLRPSALKTLHRCMKEGQSRMRNFQRGLIVDGLCLKAYPFSKILDVDHASDIAKAERFLSETR